MEKNKVLSIAAGLLLVLGIALIYFGGFYGAKVIWPPIISGVGFFLIAWGFNAIKH